MLSILRPHVYVLKSRQVKAITLQNPQPCLIYLVKTILASATSLGILAPISVHKGCSSTVDILPFFPSSTSHDIDTTKSQVPQLKPQPNFTHPHLQDLTSKYYLPLSPDTFHYSYTTQATRHQTSETNGTHSSHAYLPSNQTKHLPRPKSAKCLLTEIPRTKPRAVFWGPDPATIVPTGWQPKYNLSAYHQNIARDYPHFPTVPKLTDGVSPTFVDWKAAVLDRIRRADYGKDAFMAEVTCAFAYTDKEAMETVEDAFGKRELQIAEALFEVLEKKMKELAARDRLRSDFADRELGDGVLAISFARERGVWQGTFDVINIITNIVLGEIFESGLNTKSGGFVVNRRESVGFVFARL